jgi:hypothetical protein
MSSTRLEVIKDDTDIPPYMSRAMPAALDGLLSETAFDDFCDKLDPLFDMLDTEHRRRKKRFWWMYASIRLWILAFIIFVTASNVDYFPFALLVFALQVGAVWIFTARPRGVKSDKETMRTIRSECDSMTRRTPFVSFHVVVVPKTAAARGSLYGSCLQMDAIDHIGVSVSSSAAASGVATAVSVIMNDVSDSKNVESAVQEHPVVYAHAVTSLSSTTNGQYHKLHSDTGVEMV